MSRNAPDKSRNQPHTKTHHRIIPALCAARRGKSGADADADLGGDYVLNNRAADSKPGGKYLIDFYGSKLSFIHQTAREFLTRPELKGRWQDRLEMSKSHSKTT